MLKGKVHKYGADVNTDVIIPARYLNVSEPAELAAHCMEDIDGEFLSRVKPGDIIMATTNFGCGSSREHAPLAIKAAGISCVIAGSFARIFFRNAINIGLPLLECAEAIDNTKAGDILEVELSTGIIRPLTHHFFHEGFTRALYLANGDVLLSGARKFDATDPWPSRSDLPCPARHRY